MSMKRLIKNFRLKVPKRSKMPIFAYLGDFLAWQFSGFFNI